MGNDTRRSVEEIETVLNNVDEHSASKWPGMTYEQGVTNALRFALGDADDPMSEDG